MNIFMTGWFMCASGWHWNYREICVEEYLKWRKVQCLRFEKTALLPSYTWTWLSSEVGYGMVSTWAVRSTYNNTLWVIFRQKANGTCSALWQVSLKLSTTQVVERLTPSDGFAKFSLLYDGETSVFLRSTLTKKQHYILLSHADHEKMFY